jgi:glutamate synthase (ferredoxin)
LHPSRERDSCGIGFVADVRGRASRAVLDAALDGLRNMQHRGAVAADRRTGDGAGVLLPIPPALVPGPWCGLATVFFRDERARPELESACEAEGLLLHGWRRVPVRGDALGVEARATMPDIEQLVLGRPYGVDGEEAERRAYRALRRAHQVEGAYVASLSFRTVVYKALCAADQLEAVFPDLAEESLEVRFAIFHQRFSTNTTPSWERAQPFRMLCHNGEINTIEGNVAAMRARRTEVGRVLERDGSDSALLDNAFELLVRSGRDPRHAMQMLVPPAWQNDDRLDRTQRAFYDHHAAIVEPWDGPAALVFTDGRVVGAALDRNGLRPLRYAVTAGGLVTCASEAGAIPLPDGARVRRGRLGPGQMLVIDPAGFGLEEDGDLKRRLAGRFPYAKWLRKTRRALAPGSPVEPPAEPLTARQARAGFTREELSLLLRAAATTGHEPTSSMGDDTALPPLAGRARPLFSYFRQKFAQVTNPPIDHLRERHVTSLRTLLGAKPPLLSTAAPSGRLLELESFFLFPSAVAALDAAHLETTFTGELRLSLDRLARRAVIEVEGGADVVVLDDAGEGAVIPALLALAAVHRELVQRGLRPQCSIVVLSDEPRESHHFACLLGHGADAICPRLALETLAAQAAADKLGGDRPSPAEAQQRFRAAVEDGVLKAMARMGISDVDAYRGAQLFDALGLSHDVIEACFPGTASPLGGVGFAQLDAEALARAESTVLENPGYVKWRRGGEPHATTPEVVEALQLATRTREWDDYASYAALVDGRQPLEPRDLLELVPGTPVPLGEVESVEAIARRFSSGGMSLGALSAEAHETVAAAFNRLGAKSNSGEGGEARERFRGEKNSRIKQIASGRFGVTPEYAVHADELQIKMAQGSKPGEGGQLPGHKVTAEIARLRHTTPGVVLISPPPHHDIYSIEDLAQIVFDLRQVNPHADI